MTTVGIKNLKARLSRYVRRAASGEQVVVTERGKPVAVLGPIPAELRAMQELRHKGILLRAYDAVHLAAALEVRGRVGESIRVVFCTFDNRQAAAARAERFQVVPQN